MKRRRRLKKKDRDRKRNIGKEVGRKGETIKNLMQVFNTCFIFLIGKQRVVSVFGLFLFKFSHKENFKS